MGASITFGWTVPEGLPFVLGSVSRDGWDGWDAEAVSSDTNCDQIGSKSLTETPHTAHERAIGCPRTLVVALSGPRSHQKTSQISAEASQLCVGAGGPV